jgi:chemotaxis protein methyltransferase CheR
VNAPGAQRLSPPSAELEAFAEILRMRLGHGRLKARQDLLARKLDDALVATGIDSPAELVRRLRVAPEDSALYRQVADVASNHETRFFRDESQLRGIIEQLAAPRASAHVVDSPVRILSVGCSTGEEVYSLAMLALDALHLTWGRRVEVVGVDVSDRVVAQARAGVYGVDSVMRAGRGPSGWGQRFMRREGESLVVRELIRFGTRFEEANLIHPETLNPLGDFDVVVCRNVLIYFDPASIRLAARSMVQRLRPNGAVVVAPTELPLLEPLLGGLRRADSLSWLEPERRP